MTRRAEPVIDAAFKRDRMIALNERFTPGRFIFMAYASHYVMCRRPGAMPAVVSAIEWERAPIWERGDAGKPS